MEKKLYKNLSAISVKHSVYNAVYCDKKYNNNAHVYKSGVSEKPFSVPTHIRIYIYIRFEFQKTISFRVYIVVTASARTRIV